MNEEQLQNEIDKLYAKMNGKYDENIMTKIHNLTMDKQGIKSRLIKSKRQIADPQCVIIK